MPLKPGTRLGQYEIVGLLGAGGMGEVYRARDAQLNREVALKIVAETFAQDPDRLARLQREARALASLNHANIGSIYGFEDGGDTKALVLELIEGPTLAERLAAGVIPIDEALLTARQIAAALEAAHEAGIVHRDLKPANIKLRPDGTVKVLDFGLAKALDVERLPRDAETQVVRSGVSAQTGRGVILGTTAYMSPEQARGKPLDKRTDIWAFGCVLYEMLTGRPAFLGEDDSEVRARIIEREPNLEVLPSDTPAAVKRLVRRCLSKNPAARLRDIGDARVEIDDAMRGADAERVPIRAPARRELLAWSATFGSLVVVALTLAGRIGGDAATPAVTRTQIVLPAGQSLDIESRAAPLALSPDGRRIVYAAESNGPRQLYLRELGKLDVTPIPGTVGASQPFFSPDGRWVAFFAGETLQRVAIEGGAPLQVCAVEGGTYGGSWGTDGTIVFASVASGLQAVTASGGVPNRIPGAETGRWPERIPGSTTVLFVTGTEIVSVALDGSARRVVAQTVATVSDSAVPVIGPGQLGPVRFVPSGHLVFGHGAYRMRAAAFDASSSMITGPLVAMGDFIYRSANAGPLYFAVAANGTLVYVSEDPRRRLVWVAPDGRSSPAALDLKAFRYPHLSVDGRYVAVDVNTEERRSDIWIYDTERQTSTRLSSDTHSLLPVWHPQRLDVAYYRQRPPDNGVVRRRADGAGEIETLASLSNPAYPTSWSPDGQTLLLTMDDPVTGYDLWELTATAQAPRALLVRGSMERWARFSPDGHRIAYGSDESGIEEVYIARYPEMTEHVRVSTQGGSWPVWGPGGDALYYRQGNAVMTVPVQTTPAFELGTPKLLIEGAYVGVDGDRKFDVAPDGRLLMIEQVDTAAARQLVVVQSWSEELERLATAR